MAMSSSKFLRQSLVGLALCGALATVPSWAAEPAHVIPPYAGTEAAASAGTATAVLAGGCFWGVQGVYEHVKGVMRVEAGYTGGSAATAHYELVGTEQTGHAESVKITYDPRQISYTHLLQIFFSVAHNPTELNRQGPDTGPSYRSAIFPQDAGQAQLAKDYIAQLNKARVFDAAIVTHIEPGQTFYPAEQYHQDFLERNPNYPYIVYNDLPKVADLKRLFPADYRADPVLLLGAHPRT